MQQILGNRYEILEKIGGGGMAIVYLAKDTFLGRNVAVKVLREQYTDDPEFVRHFHKEARAVAALNHNNIVRIYDFDADNQPMYIVMEYVEGLTLKQLIEKEGPLTTEETAKIAIQIAEGLKEAHKNHIVHKDVKSHNILLNSNKVVKITDFGISQMLSNTTITHNKGMLGSAHYFSPEQARGEHVSFESDMYSLGVVMYEMLTGRVPFIGDNPVTVALKHIQEDPTPPSHLVSDISPAMENIVMTCLNKDPNARFRDMNALVNALQHILRDGNTSMPLSAGQYGNTITTWEDASISVPRGFTQKNNSENLDAKEKKKSRKVATGILYALLFLFAALITIFVARQFLTPNEVNVPSVVDMSYEMANHVLQQNGLKIEILKEEPSDSVKKGSVISQNPKAGETVKSGRSVQVVISSGEDAVSVPDISNMTVEEAENTLKAVGLRLGKRTEEYSDTVEKGHIMRQVQNVGQKVSPRTEVDVSISKGKETKDVTVPDLRGQTLTTAQEIVKSSGLSMGSIEEQYHDTIASGLVISQSLNPNQDIAEGSVINLIISKGVEKKDTSPSSTGSQTINITAPSTGMLTIKQYDKNGERLIYSGNIEKGANFSRSYNYTSKGRFDVFLDDKKIDEVIYG